MKNKVEARVISHKRKVKKCYFCGKPATSKYYIIPIRLGGKGMKNNQKDMCDSCCKKLYTIVDPPIDYLLAIIKKLGDLSKAPETRKIGFIRTNGKGGKKNV